MTNQVSHPSMRPLRQMFIHVTHYVQLIQGALSPEERLALVDLYTGLVPSLRQQLSHYLSQQYHCPLGMLHPDGIDAEQMREILIAILADCHDAPLCDPLLEQQVCQPLSLIKSELDDYIDYLIRPADEVLDRLFCRALADYGIDPRSAHQHFKKWKAAQRINYLDATDEELTQAYHRHLLDYLATTPFGKLGNILTRYPDPAARHRAVCNDFYQLLRQKIRFSVDDYLATVQRWESSIIAATTTTTESKSSATEAHPAALLPAGLEKIVAYTEAHPYLTTPKGDATALRTLFVRLMAHPAAADYLTKRGRGYHQELALSLPNLGRLIGLIAHCGHIQQGDSDVAQYLFADGSPLHQDSQPSTTLKSLRSKINEGKNNRNTLIPDREALITLLTAQLQ